MEADVLSRIDWKKCDETVQADSMQAIVAAAVTGDVTNIEVVSCSVQAIESFLLIPSDTIAISKAITRSFNQSCETHPEPKKVDDSDHFALMSGQWRDQLNLKCMTKQDWVEAQFKDKQLVKSFICLKQRSCTVEKLMKLTTMQ